LKGLEQTPGETCSPKLATISLPRDNKGRFTKAPAGPSSSAAKQKAPARDQAKVQAKPPAKEPSKKPAQEPVQDPPIDSQEGSHHSEEDDNSEEEEEEEEEEGEEEDETAEQQLHQEGAPKPEPEQEPEDPEESRHPSREPSPSPPPSPPPEPETMSVPPEGNSRPKWPAPFTFTGSASDRDPLRINSWFNTVHRYIASFGIQDTDQEALQYYGAYCRDQALDKFTQYEASTGEHTVAGLKRKFETYFLPSTSTDTIYEQWQAVKQTVNGKTAHITDTIINLERLRDSMPEGTITDYMAKQRLLDAMDIKLKRDVKPHITQDTSFDELVEIAEKRDAIAHSTGVYGSRNTHSHAVINTVTQPNPRRPQNQNN